MNSREIKVNINDSKKAIRYIRNATNSLGYGQSNLQNSNSSLQGAFGGLGATRLYDAIHSSISDINSEVEQLNSVVRELNNAINEFEEMDRKLSNKS